MPIESILHFEAIARLGSLKLAARELGLSQPAVTHSLNKLEDSVGVVLCLRSRSHFALTEAGRRLFEVAKGIRASLRGYRAFLDADVSFDGVLTVGLLGALINQRLDRALSEVAAEFPAMRLSLQVYTAEEIQRLVAAGAIDVGVGIFNQKSPQLDYLKIGGERIRHYVSERHPLWKVKRLTKKHLREHRIVWSDIVTRDRATLDAEIFFEGKHRLMRIGAYTNHLHAAMLTLQAGLGVVPLPQEYVESQVLAFEVRALDSLFKPYVLAQEAVWRDDVVRASPAATSFVNHLRARRPS